MGVSRSRSGAGDPGSGFPHEFSHTDFRPVGEKVPLKIWKKALRVKAGFHPLVKCCKTRYEFLLISQPMQDIFAQYFVQVK